MKIKMVKTDKEMNQKQNSRRLRPSNEAACVHYRGSESSRYTIIHILHGHAGCAVYHIGLKYSYLISWMHHSFRIIFCTDCIILSVRCRLAYAHFHTFPTALLFTVIFTEKNLNCKIVRFPHFKKLWNLTWAALQHIATYCWCGYCCWAHLHFGHWDHVKLSAFDAFGLHSKHRTSYV